MRPSEGAEQAVRDAIPLESDECCVARYHLRPVDELEAAHAQSGLCSVDLICGPAACPPTAQGRIDPARAGVTLSDHAGYWVEITASPPRTDENL